MGALNYEAEYHGFFHNRLLNNRKYYLFRAIYADKEYWKYFKNTSEGRFIEFGCGIGQNIFLHRKNAEGIDISEFCIKKCKSYEINASKSIEEIKNGSIDGVLCCHVLEHLENPAHYLREFLRILKPQGRLLLVLPVNQTHKAIHPDPRAGHLYAWNVPTIWALLEHAGFKVVSAKFNHSAGFSRFYRLPLILALPALSLLGWILGRKEIVIVAEKVH